MTTLMCRRRWFVVCLVAAVAAGGLALVRWWQQPDYPVPPEIPDDAIDEEIVRFLHQLRQEVLERPEVGERWGKLAMALRAHDFAQECIPCFQQAARLDPEDPRWPYLEGLSIYLYDRGKAMDKWEQALARCRSTADALQVHLRLGEAALLEGDWPSAQRHFAAVLQQQADHPRALVGRARLACLQEQWHDALRDLEIPRQDERTQKQAWQLVAEIYYQLRQPQAAQAAERQAAALPDDPPWPDPFVEQVMRLRVGRLARLQAAQELIRQQSYLLALEILDTLISRYPDDPAIQLAYAQALLGLGQPSRAEQLLRQLLRHHPSFPSAHFYLGNALLLQHRLLEASQSYRQVAELLPVHAQALFNLGHCLHQAGEVPQAIEAYRTLLQRRPEHGAARWALAELLAQHGRPADARAELEELLRQQPDHRKARQLLQQLPP
ncbi:MAG: tetratricopeptide repeat protein [Thermogemmata sp.]|nr:tetratricopeptide repeat protein [Thermogemmata sp.]